MLPQEEEKQSDEWIKLNVGGKIFTTTRTTLCTNEPNSMLARMFSQHHNPHHNSISMRPSPKDTHGAYLIDRSPKYFEPILNYLRHGKLIIDHDVNVQGVLEEAKFYGIVSLLPQLELETERWFKKKHQDLVRTSQSLHHLGLNNITSTSSSLSPSSSHIAHTQHTADDQYDFHNQSALHCNISHNHNCAADGRCSLASGGADGTQLQTTPPLTRHDVIKAIMQTTSSQRGLRFQGCNLAGANLSKLDLRYINFRYANLRNVNLKGANISGANFERADIYQSNLEGAQLIGANLAYANLENSNLRAVTVMPEDGDLLNNSVSYQNNSQIRVSVDQHEQLQYQPIYPQNESIRASLYSRANFECANLRNTNLEGSRLAEANLRMAVLKGSNLQNCDLTRAILTGADLENCDLSGSNLNEANLRKANVKGAQFELEVL